MEGRERLNMNNGNEKGYTYVDGMGFAETAPKVTEKHVIRQYSSGIATALILFVLFSRLIPDLFSRVISAFVHFVRVFLRFDPSIIVALASLVAYVMTVSLPFLFYALYYHIPPRIAVPFSKINKSDTILMTMMALGVSVVGVFSSEILTRFLGIFGIIPISTGNLFDGGVRTVAMIIQSCILAPIVEEIAIRGVVMQSLRRFGDRFALITSSIIFAAIHLNLVKLPSTFAMGLVIGYFVLRTNSLRTGIFIHAVNNILAITVALITDNMPLRHAEILTNCVFTIYLICGIVALLKISKKYKNIFYLNETKSATSNRTKFCWFVFTTPMFFAYLIVCIAIYRTVMVP